MAGAMMVTFSAAIVATLFLLELVGFEGGPYIGILAYLIFPAILLAGLVMIPIGIRRERIRAEERGRERRFPVIDMNQDRTRQVVLTVVALSVLNVIIFATATYKGVEVMESNEFCGTACHSVMQPEHAAYVGSPHARVKCVECHIGSGADWFAKSKLSGAWQVVSVTFDLYDRPIETPVHSLRPARDTCEECHWPTKFVGNQLKIVNRHQDDEANTPMSTVLLMKIGGQLGSSSHGIHWHVDPENEIRYLSDRSRENIYDVEMTLPDGSVKTYRSTAQTDEGWEEEAGELGWRVMDCVDCHNRPTHIYRTPEEEVDAALFSGKLASLPYIRREGVAALQDEYGSHAEAREGISERIETFYGDNYPDLLAGVERAAIMEAGQELGEMYGRNVFPQMNVTWGTYPDHIGHEKSIGCFRCHNDEHVTDDGDVISQDCDVCHGVLAWDEEDPEILQTLEF
jgi:hypothetical protein